MVQKILRDVKQIKALLRKTFERHHPAWLQNDGTWPLQINLNIPNESTALNNLTNLQDWIQAWQQWQGIGELQWTTRHWNKIGTQNLPSKLLLHSANDVATWLDKQEDWRSAYRRFQEFSLQFPELKTTMAKRYDVLENYLNDDWNKLLSVLNWFNANPNSQLYLRQLPIAAIDTKWIESRKLLLSQLLKILLNKNDATDFHQITGLKPEPTLIRIRILDNELRKRFSQLDFIGISRFELTRLDLPIQTVFIVENIRTGLAFHDIPNSIVIMGLGYGVECLANIPWLQQVTCYYWGDIDTHGFAILNRLRHYLGSVKSILMDEHTLLAHQNLWCKEDKPSSIENLPLLTNSELALYTALREHKWGSHIRLEQERIHWSFAIKDIFPSSTKDNCTLAHLVANS